MNSLKPYNQIKLYGLDKFMNNLVELLPQNNLPTKILLSGPKGIGKSTLAYHFINFVLSQNEKHKYILKNFEINTESKTFKTISNKSNPNFILIDVDTDKKNIDINQIRNLISNLNKSSFNNQPRFVLIDNIECLNLNAANALLKILEEPNLNIFFILINSNKYILPTIFSRCINFKIHLTNNESKTIIEKILNTELNQTINGDLINYYFTPGNIYNLIEFGKLNQYDLLSLDLKSLLKILIQNNHYKKDNLIRFMIYELIEFYFNKINKSKSKKIFNKYSYFLKKISDTKIYNLDDETFFLEFNDDILNA